MPDDCTVFPTWANRIRQRVGVPNPSYAKMLIRVDGLTTEAPPDWKIPACHLPDAGEEALSPILRQENLTITVSAGVSTFVQALAGAPMVPANTVISLIGWTVSGFPLGFDVDFTNPEGTSITLRNPDLDPFGVSGTMTFQLTEFRA